MLNSQRQPGPVDNSIQSCRYARRQKVVEPWPAITNVYRQVDAHSPPFGQSVPISTMWGCVTNPPSSVVLVKSPCLLVRFPVLCCAGNIDSRNHGPCVYIIMAMYMDHYGPIVLTWNHIIPPRFSPKVQAIGGRVTPGTLPSPRLSTLGAGHLRPSAMALAAETVNVRLKKREALGRVEVA